MRVVDVSVYRYDFVKYTNKYDISMCIGRSGTV